MILPIYLYGHPVLRKEAEDIEPDYPELKQLLSDMFETMYHSDGVGLAAPQIGRAIAVVVIDGSPLADRFPECKDLKFALINPELEVIEDEAPVSREEGCLSLPGLSEPVKRYEHIRLNWLDENFEEHEQEFTGFAARIIQHEFDHLLGTVYTDRVSPIRKQMIRTKLNNIAKGKVSCDYRTKAAPKS
ncbi:MAG: peptide deformylase [Bacteroides sp.]|nr:peptide deformylase [Bacteroides sp.]MBD5280923.1 peptide deformylase [Bacteroides sp.]